MRHNEFVDGKNAIETAAAIRGQKVLLLDCRQPEEDAIARIDGARLISAGKTRCGSKNWSPGDRSIWGGVDAWSPEIDPAVPLYWAVSNGPQTSAQLCRRLWPANAADVTG